MDPREVEAANLAQVNEILGPQARQQGEARYRRNMERLRRSHPRRLHLGRVDLRPRPNPRRPRGSCRERRPGARRPARRAHAPPGSDDPGGDDPPGDDAGHLLAALHHATPGLDGPARLALFGCWSNELQALAWAELRRAVECDRGRV
jgi:hypothetical protein